MSFFLLGFFLFYGSGHLYLFAKVKAAYALGRRCTWLLSFWLLLMTLGPLLVHWAVRYSQGGQIRLAAFVVYGWMGLLFYFVVIGLLFDTLLFAAGLVARISGRSLIRRRFFRIGVMVTILLSAAVSGYGVIEAGAIRLQRVSLITDKLSPGCERLNIVQLSDLHLGLLVNRERLREVVETVRRAKPDILVATGDLVDGQGDDLLRLARLLREIPAPGGKFAILGNHEFYAGVAYSQAFLEEAGFVVLRNEERTVAGGIVVAGVDDRRSATWPVAKSGGEERLLAGIAPQDRFVLFLKHRPQVAATSIGRFDLQLSGHVHGGQLFPFGLLVESFYPFSAGVLYPLAAGNLYVSRGTGTWGPPMRVLAPPEVTLIELKSGRGAGVR